MPLAAEPMPQYLVHEDGSPFRVDEIVTRIALAVGVSEESRTER